MPKEPKYKLIEEETLRELLSTQFQLSYSIILLSYICQRNKLDTTLTANEAGGIIKLSPRQINDARNRCLDGNTLQKIANWEDTAYAVGCITVFCGEVRLIDNIKYKE